MKKYVTVVTSVSVMLKNQRIALTKVNYNWTVGHLIKIILFLWTFAECRIKDQSLYRFLESFYKNIEG